MSWFKDQQARAKWSHASAAERAALEAEFPEALAGMVRREMKGIAAQDQMDARKGEKYARKHARKNVRHGGEAG